MRAHFPTPCQPCPLRFCLRCRGSYERLIYPPDCQEALSGGNGRQKKLPPPGPLSWTTLGAITFHQPTPSPTANRTLERTAQHNARIGCLGLNWGSTRSDHSARAGLATSSLSVSVMFRCHLSRVK